MKAKTKTKMPMNIKINILIFAVVTVLLALLPKLVFMNWIPDDGNATDYAYGWAYTLYDICPCSADDESCQGYYACGADKANLTYNIENAPEDKLEAAKVATNFENRLETNRQGMMVMRIYLLCDVSYLLSFLSFVAGVIYWNHNRR